MALGMKSVVYMLLMTTIQRIYMSGDNTSTIGRCKPPQCNNSLCDRSVSETCNTCVAVLQGSVDGYPACLNK
jgi:hypothetical protein